MKKLLKLSVLLTLFAFCATFVGCEPEVQPEEEQETPGEGGENGTDEGNGDENGGENGGEETPEVTEFSLSVKSVGPNYVELLVAAPNEMVMAYMISNEYQAVTSGVIFKKGVQVTVKNGDVIKVEDGLEENTKYYVHAVARIDDVTYSDKVELEFTTEPYNFDKMLTLLDRYPDGFKMHVTIPEETKERGNAISYGYLSRALYNMNLFNSRGGGETMVDVVGIATGAVSTGNTIFSNTTLVVNDENQLVYDQYGQPVIGDTGDYLTIHDPYIPGEPLVFLAGETRYGTKDEWAEVVGWQQPTKDTWGIPMFDRTTMSWTGAYEKVEFFTTEPELCDATLDVSIPEEGLGINDAIVAFSPEGDFFRYYYMVLNKAAYDEIMTIYLDNDESLLQWFVVSWVCANYFMVEFDTEASYINAASFFTEPLNGGETYIVVATLLGDPEGLTQRFVKKEFTTKERTKPAPVIEVTPVETGNPYLAAFNIKAGADSRGNVQEIKGAYWACEYAREWEKYLNAKYDFPTIIQSSYQTFTSAELAEINSDKGLTITFDTLDGETLRFGAYGCNDEYCFNIVDKDNNAGWADYNAPMADVNKTPVSSAYFTDLLGDWTATATMKVKQLLEDGETVVEMQQTHRSLVTISDAAPALPDAVDPYIYNLYPKNTTDDVDGMFEELQIRTDQFTEYRLEKQNRLLCTGFLDFDPARSATSPVGRFDFRSPYYLFQATDYSSVDVAQLMYDFGPKWFLEVLPDGRVIVPFSAITNPPFTAWPGYPFYVAGVGNGSAFYEATSSVPGFPVEVSADGNTITIKPIVIEDDSQYLLAGSYYMNAIGLQPGNQDFEILGTITSEIVLTRGWYGAQNQSVKTRRSERLRPVNLDGSLVDELPKPVSVRSMSRLKPETIRQYKLDETPNIVTVDMVHKSVEELSKMNHVRYGYVK